VSAAEMAFSRKTGGLCFETQCWAEDNVTAWSRSKRGVGPGLASDKQDPEPKPELFRCLCVIHRTGRYPGVLWPFLLGLAQ